MSASFFIQPIESTHWNAWLLLWHQYQHFYQTRIPDETTQVTWQRFEDLSEPMHAALAWQDGKAVGLVHFIFHRSCWTTGDYVYLQDLFVDEAARGSGVGRALIEYVYVKAEEAGASRVHWLTHETNQQAMQLYHQVADRSGFMQYRKLLD